MFKHIFCLYIFLTIINTLKQKMNHSINCLQKAKLNHQEHLVEHYQSIVDEKIKQNFFNQLQGIDFEQMNQLFRHVYLEGKENKIKQKLEFTPVENVCTAVDLSKVAGELNQIGLEAIARGQAGVCIMSGGQGTRLGFDHPKGMFDLGLKSKLTLFGFLAHKLQRLMNLANQKFPQIKKLNQTNMIKWYIMTSQMNHYQIIQYFKQNKYFGYHTQSIVFFPQGGIPAMNYQGKIVLQSQGQICLAPGGNGAIYTQMKNRGVIKHMMQNHIKYIYLGPVDNVLLKLGDPLSLGYMVSKNLEIVSHYITKRNPQEKVGIHVNVNGAVRICEYSQVSKQITQMRDNEGKLVYAHGSRATMWTTSDFIERITSDPATIQKINKKYHLAQKKIKYYDQTTKKLITPTEPNGVKFELFYFDVFEQAKSFGLFETLRQQEFSPLKNAKGDDSPQMALKMLKQLHKKWAQKQEIVLQGQGDVEIDPIVSYNGEGLKKWCLQKYGTLNVKLPLFIS